MADTHVPLNGPGKAKTSVPFNFATVFLVGCSFTTGNQLLIPPMGAAGAALGTTIAEAAVLATQAVTVRKLRIPLVNGKSALRTLIVTVIASAELFLLRLTPLPTLGRALFGAVLFFGTVYGALLALKDPVLTEMKDVLGDRLRRRRT